jgi:GTP-binding protein HflX
VRNEQIEQVNDVLREIGADHIPQILVWNKIDAAGLEPGVERDENGKISRVFISAQSGQGLDLLRDAIIEAATSGPAVPGYINNGHAELDYPRPEGGPGDGIPTSTPVGPH